MKYLALLVFASFALPLSLIDIKQRRLPNGPVVSLFGLLFLVATALSAAESNWYSFWSALKVSLFTFLVYLLLYLLSNNALGAGDVKFSASTGLVVGLYCPDKWLLAVWVSFILASVYVCIILFLKREAVRQSLRTTYIPFGPFMTGGTFIVVALTLFA